MLTRVCTLALVAFAFAGDAAASELIGREADRADLQVNGAGLAHVSWSEGGGTRHVVAGNAINARPPHPGLPQVSFQLRYGARSIPGASCGSYDGPPLAWVVVACKAPDGSYWALQRWQRLKPNYGGKSAAWELRLSHWSGPLPVLQVWTDWAYRRFDHLYGRYSYQGQPVHGFRVTPQGSPLDDYGRNLYLDTRTLGTGPAGAARTASSPSVRTEPSVTASIRTAAAAGKGTQLPGDGDRPGRGARCDVGGRPARPVQRGARAAGERAPAAGLRRPHRQRLQAALGCEEARGAVVAPVRREP